MCDSLYVARKLKLFKIEAALHAQLRDTVRDLSKLYRETTKVKPD